MMTVLRTQWQIWRAQWLARRVPAAEQITLNRRNLFIFPTKTGWIYLALTAAIFLLGSNYENNLVLALAYLLFSLFVVSMHYCHFNVSRLQISAQPAGHCYAGQSLRFVMTLRNAHAPRFDLQLTAPDGMGEQLATLHETEQLGVTFLAPKRGWLSPGRVKIASHWPLGLLECWTWLDLKQTGMVYPAPQRCDIQLQADPHLGNQPELTSGQYTQGMDEMQGIRPYRPGESLSLIAWKQVAQGRGMVSKDFATPLPVQCWLELQKTTGIDLEERLSKLCFQVQTLSQQGTQYGLLLGTHRIMPNSGDTHLQACLKALALYEIH